MSINGVNVEATNIPNWSDTYDTPYIDVSSDSRAFLNYQNFASKTNFRFCFLHISAIHAFICRNVFMNICFCLCLSFVHDPQFSASRFWKDSFVCFFSYASYLISFTCSNGTATTLHTSPSYSICPLFSVITITITKKSHLYYHSQHCFFLSLSLILFIFLPWLSFSHYI